VLSGCNSANQNTYRAATPVDARQAEIERLCNLQFWGASGRPGAMPSDGAMAYSDCMLKYSKP